MKLLPLVEFDKYDPGNLFRLNANVVPSVSRSWPG